MQSVLLITDSEGFGGAEIAMYSAAEALARAGFHVTAASPNGHPRTALLTERIGVRGVTVRRADGPLEARSIRGVSAALRREAARRAEKLIASARPDAIVVVLQNIWSGAAIVDAARAWRKDVVVAGYTQLAHLPSVLGGKLGRLRDMLVPAHLSRFDHLLAVSEAQAQALRGLGPSWSVKTVYQPVAMVRSGSRASKEEARRRLLLGAARVIGLPGRVIFRHKGQDVAVRVASRLQEAGVEAQWVVVGDGPDLDRLRGLVSGAGLSGRFAFLGWREDMESVLPAFDVVAMPSRLEGLPLTAVEAMCARVPVVAFAVDGIVDLLEAPFAVRPRDEAGFADAVMSVLRDPAIWPAEERAQLARRLCDPDVVAGRIAAALNLN